MREPLSLLHTQLPFVTCQQRQTEISNHNFKCKHKHDKKITVQTNDKTSSEHLQMLLVPTYSMVVKWKNLQSEALSMNVFDNAHVRQRHLNSLDSRRIQQNTNKTLNMPENSTGHVSNPLLFQS